MILLRRSVLMVLVLLALPSFCLAGWIGPKEVVKGEWGDLKGQFGIKSGDSDELFPTEFCVTSSGYIAIADEVNARIQVFKGDGVQFSSFGAKAILGDNWKEGWPLSINCFSNAVLAGYGNTLQIYNLDGLPKFYMMIPF